MGGEEILEQALRLVLKEGACNPSLMAGRKASFFPGSSF